MARSPACPIIPTASSGASTRRQSMSTGPSTSIARTATSTSSTAMGSPCATSSPSWRSGRPTRRCRSGRTGRSTRRTTVACSSSATDESRGPGGAPRAPDAAANRAALALAAVLAQQRHHGMLDAIPGARTLLVLFDPDVLDHPSAEDLLLRIEPVEQSAEPRTVRLPALYGGEAGPDLEPLAHRAGLPVEELVRLHAAADHRVAFLGFAPGFPYMTGAPRALAVPRM